MFSASDVLIMEDNPEVARLYSHVLQNKGHIVTVAHNAEECLKIHSEGLRRELKKKILSQMRLFLIIKCRTETD
jgi:CheY-like chemotaxis protein